MREFLERTGFYALLGTPVAAATFVFVGEIINWPLSKVDVGALVKTWAILTLLLYLIALPIAALYAALIQRMLSDHHRIGLYHVALSALLVSVVLYLPLRMVTGPSEPDEDTGSAWFWIFVLAYAPVFAAGLACRLAIPSLHRRRSQ